MKSFSEFISIVTQELEWQPVFRGKLFMGLDRISANADHFRSRLLENMKAIAKGTGFSCATGRIVLGVEIKHDDFLSSKIGKTDLLARLGKKRK